MISQRTRIIASLGDGRKQRAIGAKPDKTGSGASEDTIARHQKRMIDRLLPDIRQKRERLQPIML